VKKIVFDAAIFGNEPLKVLTGRLCLEDFVRLQVGHYRAEYDFEQLDGCTVA
jgi:hypothetical protein